MTEDLWRVVDDAHEDLRSRYQFFDQNASYCFDAGWKETLDENEARLAALRPQLEALAAARNEPEPASRLLSSIAKANQ